MYLDAQTEILWFLSRLITKNKYGVFSLILLVPAFCPRRVPSSLIAENHLLDRWRNSLYIASDGCDRCIFEKYTALSLREILRRRDTCRAGPFRRSIELMGLFHWGNLV